MSIKLMALDVDGTLTDEEGRISPENASAVRAALAAGIKVILATGRPLQGVESICQELGMSGPLILANGSLILSGTEVWFEDFLSSNDLQAVYEHGEKTGNISMLAFQPDIIQYWFPADMDKDWLSNILDSFKLYKRFDVPLPGDLPLERVNKVMYLGDEQSIAKALLNTWPEKISHLATGRSYPYLGEVNTTVANKGGALSIVCERLGISPDEVMAIGDGETDLPMLDFAGNAVFVNRGFTIPQLSAHAVVVPKEECNRGIAWAADHYL
nr:HAD family hydrolase [uncultured Caproiciproducens sp.]